MGDLKGSISKDMLVDLKSEVKVLHNTPNVVDGMKWDDRFYSKTLSRTDPPSCNLDT